MTFEDFLPVNGWGCMSSDEIAKSAWGAATLAEREACAELLEKQHTWISAVSAANLIRMRSNV